MKTLHIIVDNEAETIQFADAAPKRFYTRYELAFKDAVVVVYAVGLVIEMEDVVALAKNLLDSPVNRVLSCGTAYPLPELDGKHAYMLVVDAAAQSYDVVQIEKRDAADGLFVKFYGLSRGIPESEATHDQIIDGLRECGFDVREIPPDLETPPKTRGFFALHHSWGADWNVVVLGVLDGLADIGRKQRQRSLYTVNVSVN